MSFRSSSGATECTVRHISLKFKEMVRSGDTQLEKFHNAHSLIVNSHMHVPTNRASNLMQRLTKLQRKID